MNRDWTQPGFRAVAVYRFGAWALRLRSPVLRAVLGRIHLSLFRYVRNHYSIELPCTARIGRRFRIGHQGGIVVHHNAVIGDDCVVRQNVTIGATTRRRGQEAPSLGDRVSVAAGAVLIGRIRIGDGVRIGPNAVVMTDVPDGSTVFAPASRVVTTPRQRTVYGNSFRRASEPDPAAPHVA